MPVYRFTCQSCQRMWEENVADPSAVDCNRCARLGVTTTVEHRAKRSDAKRFGKSMGDNDLGIHTRPLRSAPLPARYRDAAESDEEDDEFDDDLPPEPEDDEYVPSPEFNPNMRFSSGGSFGMTRGLPTGTTVKPKPWTRITASAGRGSTNACFGGESATQHGTAHAPGYVGQATATGHAWEWCHLIADSLGGPTSQDNLCCGTFHANTAMLCIERVMHGKTEYEVRVDVDVLAGTHLAERITYRLRHAPSGKKRKAGSTSAPLSGFSYVIDGQATGCTTKDGTELTGLVRKFLRGH